MKAYFAKLGSFSFSVFVISFLILQIPEVNFLQNFTFASIGFFTLLSAMIYFLTSKGIKNKSNNTFFTYVYLAMGIKMLLCVAVVFFYFFRFKPEKLFFILPFFLLYICYTIFETYFLVKESKRISFSNKN